MSFNEKILNDYDESVDDEYEREVLYRATAISYVWTMNLMFIASAVLAWVLPEMYSMWAVMPMGVLIFAMAVRDSWLRKRVPSPPSDTALFMEASDSYRIGHGRGWYLLEYLRRRGP